MYLSLKLLSNYSSNLTKIVVMPSTISAVFISDFNKVFACEETSCVKLVIFANDESARYRLSSLNKT